MIYMMFGGKIPDLSYDGGITIDGNSIQVSDLVRVGRSFLGTRVAATNALARASAIEHCKGLYNQGKIEWFEVIELSSPQDNATNDYKINVSYDDEIYQAKLNEEKRVAELKAITPDSFVLFYENTGGDWGWCNYSKLQDVINALIVCTNIKRWSIKSQPQGKYICKREGGFPGKEIHGTRNDAATLDQLIMMWQDEARRLRDPNFDQGKD